MRLAILLLMTGMAWGQAPTVQEICAVMEPATRAKTEACTLGQECKKVKGGYAINNGTVYPTLEACLKQIPKAGHVIGQPEAPGYVEITEADGKMHRVCPKYQHNDGPYKCVDDIHMVTEREWQELMARLKAAEAYRKAGLESSHIAEQCLHDLGVCTDRIDAVRTRVEQEIKALESKK